MLERQSSVGGHDNHWGRPVYKIHREGTGTRVQLSRHTQPNRQNAFAQCNPPANATTGLLFIQIDTSTRTNTPSSLSHCPHSQKLRRHGRRLGVMGCLGMCLGRRLLEDIWMSTRCDFCVDFVQERPDCGLLFDRSWRRGWVMGLMRRRLWTSLLRITDITLRWRVPWILSCC